MVYPLKGRTTFERNHFHERLDEYTFATTHVIRNQIFLYLIKCHGGLQKHNSKNRVLILQKTYYLNILFMMLTVSLTIKSPPSCPTIPLATNPL